MSDIEHSNVFKVDNVNRNSIIICLENLGWLQKEPLKDHHINWIGSIYSENVFEKKWREKFFWDPYTDKQIESLVYLCKILVEKHSIENKCVGHNTKINRMESFNGIMTKSNIDENSTDLSPAFDFNEFVKKLKDE
jgi:N-acetyl-anhydromuramyl-L-alanine amidase AmpD